DGSEPAGGGDSGWVRLGLYRFWGNMYSDYVRLSDITTAAGTPTPGYVIADAVKFAPMEVWVDDDYYDWGTNDGKLWGVNAFNRIQDGLEAVASNGTVWVKPGTYVGPITITNGITLTSTGGAASTVITVTSSAGTAVWILASGATVKGFTIQSNGAEWGIADGSTGLWNWEIADYRITNNIVRGFRNGIVLYRAKGEVSYNQVYSNTERGIWIQEFPTSAPGATFVLSNTLYGNGGSIADYDIQIHDSYTGTTVMGNRITGSGGTSEAGIFVYNTAGDLVLTNNTVTGCTEGVLILQDSGTGIIQKVNLYRNEITGGGTGVRVRRTGGTSSLRQVIIGGSLANSNRIYSNSGYELRLTGYSANITATHNYWGVCTWREIEDEIYHDYDSAALGFVTYEPALCVPAQINVQAAPATLPADGFSTAVVTATATDFYGNPVPSGTMIGITTTRGTVPYAYVEENDATVSQSGLWGIGLHTCASGGQYIGTDDPLASVSWSFTGTAVSLVYLKASGGGQADVFIDGSTVASKRIDMSTST
ncbi:MAG: right-handed parallel beta-helix repeat-containing protein, partial [Chloroflexi bacterium]|nr:right-handed parallel beta-helix repeat-containing protein [Chloroflexota bacterium]